MEYKRYEKYKNSGVRWIGEIPDSWDVIPLKYVVSTPITDGPHETPQLFDEGIPFVSAEACSSGNIDFSKIRGYISLEDHEFYSRKYKPKRNDIFMIKSGATTGITAIVKTKKEFNIWSPLAVIRASSEYIPLYVLYSMRSQSFLDSVALHWSFGTQQNIGMGVIANLPIAKPSLEEQERIAEFLNSRTSEIDDLIADKEKLIELLQEQRQAIITEAVTKGLNSNQKMKDSGIEWIGKIPEYWEVTKLKYVAHLQSGDSITSNLIEEAGEYPVYGGNGLRGFTSSYTHNGKYILIGRQGALCGNVHFVDGIFWASEHAVVVTIYGDNNPNWLSYVLQSMNLNQYSESAAQPGLSVNKIENLSIPFPATDIQIRISQYLDQKTNEVDAVIKSISVQIQNIKDYRQSLISEVVTGKIDVRGYSA